MKTLKTDFLVIGSGIAGLNFALKASEFGDVIVLTKKKIIESNTNLAQGGVAAVIAKNDSYRLHMDDTLRVGEGLCDKKAVEVLVKEGPEHIYGLLGFGVRFNREKGRLALTKEGGHCRKRIVYAKDTTGAEIERAMVFQVRNSRRIKILEHNIVVDLITNRKRCIGAVSLDNKTNKINKFFAKAVLLATGGIGRAYEHTSNPQIATGDGIAMAYLAGAKIEDMEFIQFHPTTLDKKGASFLISETVRGEGAVLKNAKKEAFMKRYHQLKDLAPRDVVSRAIWAESKKGKVYLDVTHKNKDFVKKRFPAIFSRLKEHGIDMTKQLVPIMPAAHYLCGGIKTDINGRTSVNGLYACGECTCTGVHGANRLASNSLLESLVFSTRAFEDCIRYIKNVKIKTKKINKIKLIKIKKNNLKKQMQKLMWGNVGIVRNKKDLLSALKEIRNINKKIKEITAKGCNRDAVELRNLGIAAELITKSALKREESRGTHYREDFPYKRKKWEKHIVLRKI